MHEPDSAALHGGLTGTLPYGVPRRAEGHASHTLIGALRDSEARLRRESERLLALRRASTALAAQTSEPDSVLDEILRSAVTLLGAGSASLYGWDEAAGLVRCVRNWQVPAEDATPDVQVGEGLAGQTFAQGEPMIVNDDVSWDFAVSSARAGGRRAGLGVPLRHRGRPIGVLLIRSYCADSPPFTEEDARMVTLFGDQAAAALENARLYRDLEMRLDRSRALTRMNRLISSSLNMEDLLREIASAAAQLIEGTVVSFWVPDAAGECLHPRAFSAPMVGIRPVESMRFVEGVARPGDGQALVQAIITLARSLNLVAVAEGIEQAEQFEQLRALGCSLGQGYYFATQRPSEQVGALLARAKLPRTTPPAAA